MGTGQGQWRPQLIKKQDAALKTGTRAIRVTTDQGEAYVKALGNPEGPHVLVCDLVGTRLAQWFELPTFEFGIIPVLAGYGLTFFDGGEVEPGPAFITRYDPGNTWGGTDRQLKQLINPEDITRLVVFDTWTLNCDRHAPGGRRQNRDNIYLSEAAPPGSFLLRAMDHSHCFTCGKPLTPRIAHIEHVQDERVYGLFPEFQTWLDRGVADRAAARLRSFTKSDADLVTQGIPREWDVDDPTVDALREFLVTRAAFLGSTIMSKLWPPDEPTSRMDEAEPIQ
jgi:hypothetical protein